MYIMYMYIYMYDRMKDALVKGLKLIEILVDTGIQCLMYRYGNQREDLAYYLLKKVAGYM